MAATFLVDILKVSFRGCPGSRNLPQWSRCTAILHHLTRFLQRGKRDNNETVYLVIFPLVLVINDQVCSVHKKGTAAVVLQTQPCF